MAGSVLSQDRRLLMFHSCYGPGESALSFNCSRLSIFFFGSPLCDNLGEHCLEKGGCCSLPLHQGQLCRGWSDTTQCCVVEGHGIVFLLNEGSGDCV